MGLARERIMDWHARDGASQGEIIHGQQHVFRLRYATGVRRNCDVPDDRRICNGDVVTAPGVQMEQFLLSV